MSDRYPLPRKFSVILALRPSALWPSDASPGRGEPCTATCIRVSALSRNVSAFMTSPLPHTFCLAPTSRAAVVSFRGR